MANREQNHPKKTEKKTKRPILRVLGTIALIGLVTFAMLACMAAMYVKIVIMPDVQLDLKPTDLNLTSVVYYTDTEGKQQELQKLHGSENRILMEYADIPENIINATVAIEDKRFYKHNGVDWVRTVRGMLSMFIGQDIQGGSTLTQQLIKNLTAENQVTVKRKIKEIFRALEFEKTTSKEEILQWYLNSIFLGEGCYGIYTASYAYFGKNVSELTIAESASLIGITNNPSLYNPYRNAAKNKERQENILKAMYDQKKISKQDYETAKAEELKFVRGEDETRVINPYSWYVDTVIDEVINDLCEKNNYSKQYAADLVYSGGLQIYSCYNKTVQDAVDTVYANRENLNYTSPSGQAMQSAITVVDNKTGGIIATAGGVGKKEGSRVFNRASQTTLRPPGSAIKPLAVYAPALELGLITPVSVERDSPVDGNWPKNAYTGYRKGLLTMVKAMEISCNTIAVKVLDKVTPEESFKFMRDRFHIELVESRTDNGKVYTDVGQAQLALGGLTDGVSMYEMAAAYSVFPRDGIYIQPKTYDKVVDKDGKVILERNTKGDAILKAKTAYYINGMLENVVTGSEGTGDRANFTGMSIAGKTGTTDKKKDLWFVGYTPYYTAAVWTGYDQPEEMTIRNPSPGLWKQVMQAAHKGVEYKKFTAPDASSLVSIRYCSTTGLLASSYCPVGGSFALFKEDVPKTCTTHKAAPQKPPSFNADDPTTWPKDDPNFDADDPATWPGASGGTTDGTGTGDTQTPTAPNNPTTPTPPTTPVTPNPGTGGT